MAAPPGTRVGLSVEGLPADWESQLQAGGYIVDEVLVDETGHVEVTLNVDVPATASEGSYDIAVTGSAQGQTSRLDLSIDVAQGASGGVTLSTDFPFLQGPPTPRTHSLSTWRTRHHRRFEQADGTIPTSLSSGQSILFVWPQLVGLIAATVVIFAIAYILFMRREVRA